MKTNKIVALMLSVLLSLTFVACGGNKTSQPAGSKQDSSEAETGSGNTSATSDGGYELALITDLGTIDDKSFNQSSWEGLVKYAEENNISHKYYQPKEQSDDAYLSTIDLAVKGGAKVVITPGFLFAVPIFHAQTRYPDVHFILVDDAPKNPDTEEVEIAKNAVGIKFHEEEAGFLAGYAAVKDGMTNLGNINGMAVPAVVRYGYGFIQGAEYAAQEMGLGEKSIQMKYHYSGGFSATPEVQSMAASWFNDGAEVIFANGGGLGSSVMAAGEQSGKKVIGVDVDQSFESSSVITSAMKSLTASVYDCIDKYYKNEFPGGEILMFGAENDGVGLPMETSKFEKFNQSDYDAIFAKLKDGSIKIIKDINEDGVQVDPSEIPLTAVNLTVI